MNLARFSRPLRSGMLAAATVALTLAGCDSGEGGDDMMGGTTLPMDTGSADGMDDGGDDGTSDSTGGDDGGSDLSHEADIQPIWEKYCVAGCHEPGGLWPTFDQSGDATENYEQIVSSPGPTQATTTNLIEPGDPSKSYLWLKINNMQLTVTGGSGVVMPDKRPEESMAMTLSQDELDTLEQWILDGAPE